jgi:hypothetical protein
MPDHRLSNMDRIIMDSFCQHHQLTTRGITVSPREPGRLAVPCPLDAFPYCVIAPLLMPL